MRCQWSFSSAPLALVIPLKKMGGLFGPPRPNTGSTLCKRFAVADCSPGFGANTISSAVQVPFTIGIAVLVFVLWIAPQSLLGFPARTDGFNPDLITVHPAAYWSTVFLRFLRLVVIVPLVEGFLEGVSPPLFHRRKL